MGYKKLERTSISFSVVLLLIFSQIINVTDSFPDDEKPLEVNSATYGCYDFLIANNEVYALLSDWLDIWDISNPSKPIDTRLYGTINTPQTITKDENTVLFAEGYNYQYSTLFTLLYTLEENNITEVSKIDYYIQKMVLKNDLIYCVGWTNETKIFAINNATDINDVQLLGSTNISYYLGYYLYSKHIPDFYYINENNVYFITMEGNLDIYQVNNTYQLSLLKTYSYTDLNNLHFTDEYLYTCDNNGLQVFNYSNLENLKLVKQYNITDARSIQVRNNIAYLITSKKFIVLNITSFEDIKILDQYNLHEIRETKKLMKIGMRGNLAIVMTEELSSEAPGYGGYLYIFDVSSPTDIKRIYPEKIPLNQYSTGAVLLTILVVYGIPILGIALIITIPIVIVRRKQRKEIIVYKRE